MPLFQVLQVPRNGPETPPNPNYVSFPKQRHQVSGCRFLWEAGREQDSSSVWDAELGLGRVRPCVSAARGRGLKLLISAVS